MTKLQPPLARSRPGTGASALLLVLWAMFLMSFTVLGVVEFVTFGLDETVIAAKDFRARQLAESGLAIGLHPRVRPGDPVLNQELPNGDTISVRIAPEDSRLPINLLLQRDQAPALTDLFVRWGMEDQDAAVLADSLADWVDGNDTTRINGAENDYYTAQGYPDYPHNRPFVSLDEMLAVRGMDKLTQIKPDWRDYFTVYGSGLLNLNGAAADSIETITGVSPEQAQAVVDYRNGQDGLPDTEDDVPFRSLEEVRAALNMDTADFRDFSSRLTVETTVLRVESKGTAGNDTRTLTIVAALAKGKRPVTLASMEN